MTIKPVSHALIQMWPTLCYAQNRMRSAMLGNHLNSKYLLQEMMLNNDTYSYYSPFICGCCSGSPPYEKLTEVLTKGSLLKDIKQMSGAHATLSLEAFHSVQNHFATKRLAFSYQRSGICKTTGWYCSGKHCFPQVQEGGTYNKEDFSSMHI